MMSITNTQAYKLITDLSNLHKLVDRLSNQPIVAVDTESNSLYAFREQVCLLQFSIPGADYLVDPLAIKDLSCLAPIFASEKIEKVFHAAEYDVICLKRDFGFQFKRLFDTMAASRILGRKAFGLSSLLLSEFGVTADKHFQRANWGQRPLPINLLEYASQDTHYLIPLRDRLAAELAARGLTALAEEDFHRLALVENNHDHAQDGRLSCLKVRGTSDLTPQQMAILQELCQYRLSVARASNRPLFKVIHDSTLVAIAVKVPTTQDELSRIPGMSQNQVRRHGSQILKAVRRGQRAEPVFPTKPPRPSEAYLQRLERLRQWRKESGDSLQVLSDVILPRDLMEELALRNPGNREALAVILESVPYRLERFGDEILKVLNPIKKNVPASPAPKPA
jgi:ribonuclease D